MPGRERRQLGFDGIELRQRASVLATVDQHRHQGQASATEVRIEGHARVPGLHGGTERGVGSVEPTAPGFDQAQQLEKRAHLLTTADRIAARDLDRARGVDLCIVVQSPLVGEKGTEVQAARVLGMRGTPVTQAQRDVGIDQRSGFIETPGADQCVRERDRGATGVGMVGARDPRRRFENPSAHLHGALHVPGVSEQTCLRGEQTETLGFGGAGGIRRAQSLVGGRQRAREITLL